MRQLRWISVVLLPLAFSGFTSSATAQGKGSGKDGKDAKARGQAVGNQDKGRSEKPDKAKQQDARGPQRDKDLRAARGNSSSRAAEVREVGGTVDRNDFRVFASSKKHGHRLAGLAVARANKGGKSDDEFVITPVGNRVHVLNRSGVLLLDLDDDRDVGRWRVVSEPDRNKKGAPSFCASGEGHPVWGRQWCVEKGFGLGTANDLRWGRIIQPDVTLRRTDADRLDRTILTQVLGDVVFNRLAAHAITLGLTEPLSARWLGEQDGPRVLLLTSGDRPVAEIVDVDRDNRAEMLVVALRPR